MKTQYGTVHMFAVLASAFMGVIFAGPMPGDLNVRDFGAKGDGVTDDTAAFTAAGDAMWRYCKSERRSTRQRYRKNKSGSQDGPKCRLYVPKGKYRITGPAFFRNDTYMAGEDGAELVGACPSNDIVYVFGAHRVRIEGLAFSGGRSHLKVETLNNESANIRITGCRFRDSAATAFCSPSFGLKNATGGKSGVGEWRYDKAERRFVRDERYVSPEIVNNNHSSMVVVDNCVFENCEGAIGMCPDGSVVRNCRFAMASGAKVAAIDPGNLLHAYGLEISHYAGSSAFAIGGNKTALWLEDSSITTPDGSGARVFIGAVNNHAQVAHVIMSDVRTDAGLRPGNAICNFTNSFPAIAALVRVTAEGPNEVSAFRFSPDESEERFNASRSIKTWEIDRFFSYGIRDCGANIVAPHGSAKRFVREVPSWAAEAGGSKCHMECPDLKGAVRECVEPKWHVKFRTRVIEKDTVISCGGVAAFAGVGPDAPWFVVKNGAKAVFHNLQVHGGKSFVVVEEGAEAYVDSCYSYDCDGVTFVCQKGGKLFVDNGVYYAGCLYDGDGDAFIRSIWYKFTDVVPQDMPIGDEAAIVNRGRLVLWDILGVPQVFSRFDKKLPTLPLVTEYTVRWIDNFGELRSRMVRYGSERGGLTPAWHHGTAKTFIEGHYAGFWNRSVPHTPVMCDSPDSDVRMFGVAFSLYRQHLDRIEMLWQDANGTRHPMPKANIHFTCPTKEPDVPVSQHEAPTDLYLLIGQSNMAGRGITNAANRLSSERVLKFTRDGKWAEGVEPIHFDRPFTGAGPGLAFARAMADADKDAVIGLIPCAEGGSPLSRWEPGHDLYTNAVARTKAALASGGRLRGILWHQGEADAWHRELAETYARRLTNMVTQLRSDLGGGKLPFIAGEIAAFYGVVIEKLGGTSSLDIVNKEIKSAVALLHDAGLVSVEGVEPGPDGIHYRTECAYELGRRYAHEMQILLK